MHIKANAPIIDSLSTIAELVFNDDPYQGIVDYDYLMAMQDSAIEEQLRSDLEVQDD